MDPGFFFGLIILAVCTTNIAEVVFSPLGLFFLIIALLFY